MTARRRNLLVLLFVLGLVAASAVAIATKPTRLGLDLKGGVELVYQAQPTPKVPKVTPQAIDDALSTINKRINALGVSEPEVQRSGPDQVTVSLPDVQNAQRAIKQVGTTAQLQFYDWEPNVRQAGGDPNQPILGLYPAVQQASKAKPKAEATDIPPGGPDPAVVKRFGGDQRRIREFYDRQNDTAGPKLYLFGPGKGADRKLLQGPAPTCQELLSDYVDRAKGIPHAPGTPPKGGSCQAQLAALGSAGPPPGSQILTVPRGIVVLGAERPSRPLPGVPPQYYVLEDDSELSGDDLKDPKQTFDPQTQQPIVTFSFTPRGQRAFAAVTKRIAERGANQILPPGAPPSAAFQRFAIVLDNQIVTNPTIDFRQNPEGIDGRTGAEINGIGSIQEAQDLANNLRIGALPVNLKLISNTQVSATLGKQALNQGLIAGLAGLALTLIFLLAFYRVLGVVAGVALVTYAVLLYAVVKVIPITLTLPGIAGLILTLGVAADANIVIFERVKEEARAGASTARAITAGYAKALRTIVDANVVTIGVAFILFVLAQGGVKGFAFTLGIGTIVSLITAVVATNAVLGSLSRTRVMRSKMALGVGSRERRPWSFDFMGASRWFFSMSGAILAAGAIAIAVLGLNLGIDFTSGTRITTPVTRPASVAQVRSALPANLRDAKIQQVTDPQLGRNVFQISVPKLGPGGVAQVRGALDRSFGVRQADFSVSSIGPTFGAQIARTALIAVLASLFLISLYIGLRFEFKFAVPVLIALAHDLLITAGVYALTGREVTTSTVAALLTILGYSLYDTIIVFDRIRENVPRMPRATFSQIVNRSMSEVLTRSLVTSLSTLLPITALMVFGGETLRDFGFALLVGVASGTYSSIFIASPVLTAWKEREQVYRRRRVIAAQDHGGVVPAYATGAVPGAAEEADGAPAREPARAERLPRRARGRRGSGGAAPTPGGGRGAVPERLGNGRGGDGAAAADGGDGREGLPEDGEPARAGARTGAEPRAPMPEGDGGDGGPVDRSGRAPTAAARRARRAESEGLRGEASDAAVPPPGGSPRQGADGAGDADAKGRDAGRQSRNRRRKKHGRR